MEDRKQVVKCSDYDAKRRKLDIVTTIILIGFGISVFFHYYLGTYLGMKYPYDTFLFVPNDAFNDLFNPLNQTRELNPYFGNYKFPSNYYPFTHILLYPLTLVTPLAAFIIYCLLVYGAFLFIVYRFTAVKDRLSHIKYAFVVGTMTYPVLFTFDRANLDAIIFIFLYVFLKIYENKPYLGSIALSAAISMKAFPAVFLSLLLSQKKYRAIIATAVATVGLTLASMMMLEGGFSKNIEFFLGHVGGLNKSDMIQPNNLIQRGVSLFTLLKLLLIKMNLINVINIDLLLKIYAFTVVAAFAGITYIICKKNICDWEKVFLLVSCMLLFPHFSADYKLIYMFFPLAIFINEEFFKKEDFLISFLFGALLIPKDYHIIKGVISDSGISDISIAVPLNIIIIIIMNFIVIKSAFKKRQEHFT